MSIYCPQSIYCPLCGNHHAASQPCEVTLPTSDANDLDDVVRELGIEASDTTPTEAVRELKATIDRLRDELAKYEAAGKGLLPDCEPVFGAGVCAAFQFARAALGKVGAELANARLERDNIAALNSSLIAELAEARRALLAGNDTVLANKKLQEDNAAKDRIIANLDARSAQYKRDSVAKDARVAKLEAYHTNCTDYINGMCGSFSIADSAYILRAANAFPHLVAALDWIYGACAYEDSYTSRRVRDKALEALAIARGEVSP